VNARDRFAADWPTGRTEVVGIIGSPVRHSLSPALHNAAFRSLGLDWAYLAFEVAAGDGAAAIAGARALGLRGLSVTMPHKQAAYEAADHADALVRSSRSANTLVFDGSGIHAHSTDGEGFLRSLAGAGFDPSGRRCAVLGAGGAARAVVRALAGAGAGAVVVWSRRRDAAEAAVAGVPAALVEGSSPEAAAAGADLVVNATPVGMEGVTGASPVDPSTLRPGQLVADLVYEPRETVLLREARRAGAAVLGGLPMLVHQAAIQSELWTGRPAPLDAMWAAAGGAGA
jgi:shikimate dehydrogenase